MLHDSNSEKTYENALKILDSLISRKAVTSGDSNQQELNLEATSYYIDKLGLDISKLPMIHIAGTKGKGSTSAFCELILRKNGLRTGLFTSPHLIDIRERIRINGSPVSKEVFTKAFWECYDNLNSDSITEKFSAMSTYFRFMVVIAFKILVDAKVDVAIMEVGIGGKYDATNIIRPVVCGITSIGYDHMEILGNTIHEIASQKAGIMKQGVPCITCPQKEEVLDAFIETSKKEHAPLYMCPSIGDYERILGEHGHIQPLVVGLNGEHQRLNASLALALCHTFLQRTNRHHLLCNPPLATLEENNVISKFNQVLKGEKTEYDIQPPSTLMNSNMVSDGRKDLQVFLPSFLSDQFVQGLRDCKWAGRCEILNFSALPGLNFYIDGAHTDESLDLCRKWFASCVQKDAIPQSTSSDDIFVSSENEELNNLTSERRKKAHDQAPLEHKKILVFNYTGPRDPKKLLASLAKSDCVFDTVIFCPTDSLKSSLSKNSSGLSKQEEDKLLLLEKTWLELTSDHEQKVIIKNSINDVLEYLWDMKSQRVSILITGSIYLIGDFSRKLHKIHKTL